jgi:hypothetical protein
MAEAFVKTLKRDYVGIENGGGKVCHGSGGIVPLLAE